MKTINQYITEFINKNNIKVYKFNLYQYINTYTSFEYFILINSLEELHYLIGGTNINGYKGESIDKYINRCQFALENNNMYLIGIATNNQLFDNIYREGKKEFESDFKFITTLSKEDFSYENFKKHKWLIKE